tara:strand:- start:1046 stop:1201 length:156 start_codon:yes stop_codon:yes gene_type:complete
MSTVAKAVIYVDEISERTSDNYDPYSYVETEDQPVPVQENEVEAFTWEEEE